MKNLSSSTYFGLFILTCDLYPCSDGLHRGHASGQDSRGPWPKDLHCWGGCRPRRGPDPIDDGGHD